jgi:hypothetical protein
MGEVVVGEVSWHYVRLRCGTEGSGDGRSWFWELAGGSEKEEFGRRRLMILSLRGASATVRLGHSHLERFYSLEHKIGIECLPRGTLR